MLPTNTYCMCRAPDPAASQACLGFAFAPAADLAAAYNLPITTVLLVQGYLAFVAQKLVGPKFEATVLGTPLGPSSGGLVVKRTLQEWLYGRPQWWLEQAGSGIQSGRNYCAGAKGLVHVPAVQACLLRHLGSCAVASSPAICPKTVKARPWRHVPELRP